jgi:hypothetical protein
MDEILFTITKEDLWFPELEEKKKKKRNTKKKTKREEAKK